MSKSIHGGAVSGKSTKGKKGPLEIIIGDKTHHLDQEMLGDEDALAALRKKCETSSVQPIKIYIGSLPSWPPDKRISVLDFLFGLPDSVMFRKVSTSLRHLLV